MKPILFNTEMVKAVLEGRKTVTRRLVKQKYSNTHLEMLTNKYGTRLIELQNNVEGETYGKNPDGTSWQKLLGMREVEYDHKPCNTGDILYVRETFADTWTPGDDTGYVYKADGEPNSFPYWGNASTCKDEVWRPSLHMPKEASRIFLRVKAVRVERLQDISEEQAIKEGISKMYDNVPDAEYEDWAKRVCSGKKKEEWTYTNYLWHGNFGSSGSGNKLSDAWKFQCSGYERAIGSFSSLWNTTVPFKEWEQCGWEANPWVWVIEFERISKEEALKD